MGVKDFILSNAKLAVKGKVAEGVILATGAAVSKVTKNLPQRTEKIRIVVPRSSDEYIGKNYEDVVEELEAYGFQSIGLVQKRDLIKGWFVKDGAVEEITINGKSHFRAKAKFSSEVHVVITYHTFIKSR